jgi:hypothetical protein
MRPIGHASQRPEVVKEETVEEATNAVLAGPPRDTWGRNSKPEKRKKNSRKRVKIQRENLVLNVLLNL